MSTITPTPETNTPNPPQLQWHAITSPKDNQEKLHQLCELGIEVFESYYPAARSHYSANLENWKEYLLQPHSILLYATKEENNNGPLGFFFAIQRTQPEIGSELMHLWIAAVHPKGQGLGVFPLLMGKLMEHARKCGYEEMTVCTFPNSYKKMYRILGKNGWEEVCWPADGDGEKVLFKRKL